MKYAVVYEKTARNYSAYIPDLPGCVATGTTRAQVERRVREAIALHLGELKRERAKPPKPSAWTELVEVSA